MDSVTEEETPELKHKKGGSTNRKSVDRLELEHYRSIVCVETDIRH